MKKILAICVLFLFLAACAKTGSTQTVGIPDAQKGSGSVETQAKTTADTIAQVKAETEAKNDPLQDLFIPINIKQGKAGDTFIIGTIFNLVNKQPGIYLAGISFIEARDSSYNRVEISKDTANSWVTAQESFTLGDEKSKFVPIIINPSKGASPGTYTYEVQMYEVKSGFNNKLDKVVKNINVKIIE